MASLADRIDADLDLVSDLPSAPSVLVKLSATLGRADVELIEIEEIISQDPVVAGRVIHAANAAAYAAHSPTATIHNALLRLGVVRVRRLALLVGLYNALPERRLAGAFWPHSLAAASCAEVVTRTALPRPPGADPDAVFLAALLHDLGLLVLASHYPREYKALHEALAREGRPLDELEDAMLGIDHGAIGERLARHWLLPPPVCAAIRAHHRLDTVGPEHRGTALIVHLADSLCYRAGIAEMNEGVVLRPDDPALAELGIDEDMLAVLVVEAQLESQQAARALTFDP